MWWLSRSAIKVGNQNHKESVGTYKTSFAMYRVRGYSLIEFYLAL